MSSNITFSNTELVLTYGNSTDEEGIDYTIVIVETDKEL